MNVSRRLLTLTLGTLATAMLALGAPSGLAATSTGRLTVDALVANSCTIGDATLDFGTYSSGAGAMKATTATVNCTLAAPYSLTMDQGQNVSTSTPPSNRMKAIVGTQSYYIPYTAAFTSGTLVSGVSTLSGVGTGIGVPVAINGAAPAGANVPAASYTDSVTMTVMF